MKKILAALMALVMLFGLCACSAEQEEEFVPARGTVENNVYKNEAFGISYTAEADWYYYTDDEIAATMGITAEELFTDEYAEAIADAEIIYDMYCANLTTGETVNVNYENLGAIYGTVLDEEAYIASAAAQLENQLAASGLSITKNEAGTATVDGKEVPCLYVTMEYSGVSIYEVIVVKKVGDWMGAVTVASLEEAELENLVSNVSFE
ncbi:MAG: hypothetical protein IJ306_07240 [Oscillospiraceae bacterium]|nr:hypothetical protein [Oscillospiraceae bacterium]